MGELSGNPWDLFPRHRHIGTDASGNEVVVDLTGDVEGSVYGLWHDPPAVVVLARSEAEFRRLAPEFNGEGAELPEGLERLIGLPAAAKAIGAEVALEQLEAGLREWVKAFPADAQFLDLRPAEPGSGFAWGLRDTFAKHPSMAVFAIHSAPKPKGWMARLLGG